MSEESPLDHSNQKLIPFNQPVLATGQVVFFDYSKNKFGMIGCIKTYQNFGIPKARIDERALKTENMLSEGDYVVFKLHQGNRGFYGSEVRRANDLTVDEALNFLHLFSLRTIISLLDRLGNTGIQKLSDSQLKGVNDFLINQKDPEAWRLVKHIGLTSPDDYFRIHFSGENIIIPFSYLKKSFDTNLLIKIGETIDRWTKVDLLEYMSLARKNNYPIDNLPERFWQYFKRNSFTYTELQPYESQLHPTFREGFLKAIPLADYMTGGIINAFVKVQTFSRAEIEVLKFRIKRERSYISASAMIDLFSDLKKCELFNSTQELVELLEGKRLSYRDINAIMNVGIDGVSPEIFEQWIIELSQGESFRRKLEILQKIISYDLAGIALALFFEGRQMKPEDRKVLFKEAQKATSKALYIFISRKLSELAASMPGFLAIFSLRANHFEGLKLGLLNFKPATEADLGLIIKELANHSMQYKLQEINPLFFSLTNLHTDESGFNFTTNLKEALVIYRRAGEAYLIKWLISCYHQNKLSKNQLVSAVNEYPWVTISALIMQSFIVITDHSEEYLLKSLSNVMHIQFQRINDLNLDGRRFLDTFTISGIITKCHGRTQYAFDREDVNGVKRLMIESDEPEIRKKEAMNCFCEGRPWLTDHRFINRRNGRESIKSYDLHWCKTQHCALINNHVDLAADFAKWTLYDIAAILHINIASRAMTTLAGWANRMNSITEHLMCRQCKSVLRPLPFEPHILGNYAVPVFNCINQQCREHGKTIRFTHCLNGKCAITLDSRDNQSCCGFGMRCHSCGTTCPRCQGRTPVRVGYV